MRAVEADVPQGIMPAGIKASLTDIKVVLVTMQNMRKSINFFKKTQVGGDKRAPDDKLYNAHADLREKVARGNSVLYYVEKGKMPQEYAFIPQNYFCQFDIF